MLPLKTQHQSNSLKAHQIVTRRMAKLHGYFYVEKDRSLGP